MYRMTIDEKKWLYQTLIGFLILISRMFFVDENSNDVQNYKPGIFDEFSKVIVYA